MQNIRSLLRIFLMLYIDIRDLIVHTGRHFSDKTYIGYCIRKQSHMLEKLLKNMQHNSELSKLYGKDIYIDLINNLSVWKIYKYENEKFILWAAKIAEEYKEYLESGSSCPMVGKRIRKKKYINLLSLIKERRSIRNWSGERLSSKHINTIIEAAKWAPSSCNRQTSHFLIVDEEKLIKDISVTVRGGRFFFDKATILIVVLNDSRPYLLPEEKYIIYQDGAAAIENLLLMSHSLGLGTCWGAYTSDTGIIRSERKVRSLLHIPIYFKISGVIALGLPNEKVCDIPRREYHDIVSFNRFSY